MHALWAQYEYYVAYFPARPFINGIGIPSCCNSATAALRRRVLTQAVSDNPPKSAAFLNASFSKDSRRTSRYPAFRLSVFFFGLPRFFAMSELYRQKRGKSIAQYLTCTNNVGTINTAAEDAFRKQKPQSR